MASSSSVQNLSPCLASSPQSYAYPPPLARYEDVVANPKLFITTLEKLHAIMRTKFMIPVIGGKELDLHRLFVEVTSRGGIEKVVLEKKWKEVTAVFNFPSSATNASFVLRKYYVSLLHHYEQIYFFKAVNLVPSSDFVTPHKTPMAARGGYDVSPLPATPGSSAPQQNLNVGNLLGAQGALTDAKVTGIIDGKFDSGYLVTVTVGSQKLKGVLYHAAQQASPFTVPYASGSQRRRRRKKSEIKRRDPAHPKPNISGYNFFFAEQHAKLKTLHSGKDREISKMIGELWTNLNETERSVYQEKAMRDKERYKTEMEGYRERIRTGQIHPNPTALPVQQMLLGQGIDAKVGESGSGSEESGDEEDLTVGNDSNLEPSGRAGGEEGGNGDETGDFETGKGIENAKTA